MRKINAALPFADPIEPRYGEAVGWPSSAEIEAFGTFGYVPPKLTAFERKETDNANG